MSGVDGDLGLPVFSPCGGEVRVVDAPPNVNAPTHDRLVAMRTELIRLCHSNDWTPEQVADRADVYLDFILNGLKKEQLANE